MKPASLFRLVTALFFFSSVVATFAQAQSSAADRARLLRGQATLVPPTAPGVSPEGVDQNYAVESPNDTDLGE